MSQKQTVRFRAFQEGSDNTFEIEKEMLSKSRNRQFGKIIRMFLRWYKVMKDFKVNTGFSGKNDIYFSIEVNGFEVVNTKVLASKFKTMNKFKLNKTARAQHRFTALAWALFGLSEDFAKKAKRVSDELSIEDLLASISEQADKEYEVLSERRLIRAQEKALAK